MSLTPTEAASSYARMRAVVSTFSAALEPDDDGKVRLTRGEATKLVTDLLGAAVAFLVDLVD